MSRADGTWQVQYKGSLTATVQNAYGQTTTLTPWNKPDWQTTPPSAAANGKGVMASVTGNVSVQFKWVTNDNTPPPAELNVAVSSGAYAGSAVSTASSVAFNGFESKSGSPGVNLTGKYLVSRSGSGTYEFSYSLSSVANSNFQSNSLINAGVGLSAAEDARKVRIYMDGISVYKKRVLTGASTTYMLPFSNIPNDSESFPTAVPMNVTFNETSRNTAISVDRGLLFGKHGHNTSPHPIL